MRAAQTRAWRTNSLLSRAAARLGVASGRRNDAFCYRLGLDWHAEQTRAALTDRVGSTPRTEGSSG